MSEYTNIIKNDNTDEHWAGDITSNDTATSSNVTTSANVIVQVIEPNNINSRSPIESTCPTCQGKGKLTQSQADNLVALIPACDKRLKPRRTKLYLAITAVVSVVCGFLIGFFLWPRSVYSSIIDVRSTDIHISGNGTIYIDVTVIMQLHNNNYFEVNVNNVKDDVTWNKIYNLYTIVKDFHPINLKKGEVKKFTFITKQIFRGVLQGKVKKSCLNGWNWALLEKFVFYLTISSMLTSDDIITESTYKYILCYNSTAFVK